MRYAVGAACLAWGALRLSQEPTSMPGIVMLLAGFAVLLLARRAHRQQIAARPKVPPE
jgi:hypothetical protein